MNALGHVRDLAAKLLALAAIGFLVYAVWIHTRPEKYYTEDGAWEKVDLDPALLSRLEAYQVVLPAKGRIDLEWRNRASDSRAMVLTLYEAELGEESIAAFARLSPSRNGEQTGTDFFSLRFEKGFAQAVFFNTENQRQTLRVLIDATLYSRFNPATPSYAPGLCRQAKERDNFELRECAPTPIPPAASLPTLETVRADIRTYLVRAGALAAAAVVVYGLRSSVLLVLFPSAGARRYRRGLKQSSITRASTEKLGNNTSLEELRALRQETREKITDAKARLEQHRTAAQTAELKQEAAITKLREELEQKMREQDQIADELRKKIEAAKK